MSKQKTPYIALDMPRVLGTKNKLLSLWHLMRGYHFHYFVSTVFLALAALARTGMNRLVVAGGVGANASLRAQLGAACAAKGVRVHYPELHLCTDNGAMIALAAAMRLQRGLAQPAKNYAFDVRPRWGLDMAPVLS